MSTILPILLAPAGNFACLSAALANGADAVYFGVGHLNMRSRGAVNFTIEDLPEICHRCHDNQALAYLALNTLIYENELNDIEEICAAAATAGIDAIIAADVAVVQAARRYNLPVHLSVQANISNSAAVRFQAQFCDALVLARELNINQISAIHHTIENENICGPSGHPLRLEIFAHGALCIGVSGRCGMSLCSTGHSSARGDCFQNCRRAYLVKDQETGWEFQLENQYIMSPKDICTLRQLPELLQAGASILKIEGRGRSADYVAKITATYRQALNSIINGHIPTTEQYDAWMQDLSSVFNRGFWEGGYYLGEQLDPWGKSSRNQATKTKIQLGNITNYYAKIHVAEFKITAGDALRKEDEILITGSTTGAIFDTVTELRDTNGNPTQSVQQGETGAFPCQQKVRPGDKLFVLRKSNC